MKQILVILCLLGALSCSAQQEPLDSMPIREWNFLSFGGLIGYQYQNSSYLELGVGADLVYRLLFLSTGFSVENDFGRKILGLKGSFKLGLGIPRAFHLFGGIDYVALKQSPQNFKDAIARIEAGVFIPAGMPLRRSKRLQQLRFNIKLSYFYNEFLDVQEIQSIGRHGFHVSILVGYAVHLGPNKRGF